MKNRSPDLSRVKVCWPVPINRLKMMSKRKILRNKYIVSIDSNFFMPSKALAIIEEI